MDKTISPLFLALRQGTIPYLTMKMAQIMIDKSERKAGRDRTKDYFHWKENGWLDGKKPWKE